MSRKPLEVVDFSIVQEPLAGLLRNADSDLHRRINVAAQTNDPDELRRLTLLLLMQRFAVNSYQAVGFLLSDVDEHPKRLPKFVLTVPSINRQLMDLWFSLVYIMDDFGPRALLFDQVGYREVCEEIARHRQMYGSDAAWNDWFVDMNELKQLMERQIPMTAAQRSTPSQEIPYWLGPYNLSKQKTKSQKFLKFLEKLMYHDTSAEAHLKPGGLFMAGSILLADIAIPEVREQLENRTIHQYKFRQFCRTVLTVLGVLSEVELYCHLNNREQLVKVWSLLAGYNADVKDVYVERYQLLLTQRETR